MIGVSIGTVGVLGLDQVPMETAPTTAYFMLGGRCAMNCAFCAQARDSHANALYLSRVTWPEYDIGLVLPALKDAMVRGEIRRACIQVTVHRDAFGQACTALRAIKEAAPDLPVDVAILPRDLDELQALFEAGADHVGFGLDAAARHVFEQTKENRWDTALDMLERAACAYRGRIAAHVIIGLGETEREATELMQRLADLGVTVGLFAFTPVRGTRLADAPTPDIGQYRRMQVARHLICRLGVRMDGWQFSASGRLLTFGRLDLHGLLADGQAFLTSGCPDCNRPYYNERPGGVMYNYPRRLTEAETAMALADLDLASHN